MSGEGWPTAGQIAEAVAELYRPHLDLLTYALTEIARVSRPELNSDGVDQSSATMQLIAVEALSQLGISVPEQRTSMDDGVSCICGRGANRPVQPGSIGFHKERQGETPNEAAE